MYGLRSDVDLGFLADACLVQVCVGENEVILNFEPGISIMIAANVRLSRPEMLPELIEDSRVLGPALVSLLGDSVEGASVRPGGTLRMVWRTGAIVELLDSWEQFESYTVTHGDSVLVV